MKVIHSKVGRVVERGPKADPAGLTLGELRMCFPGSYEFLTEEGPKLRLPDTALFGVLAEVAEMWGELCRGAHSSSRSDLDGAYNLKLELREPGSVVLADTWHEDEALVVGVDQFHGALGPWVDSLFSSALEAHPTLAENGEFGALRRHIDELIQRDMPERRDE